MKNYLRIDDVNRQIVMDREFDKNRQIVGTTEYNMLQQARQDYPTYAVTLRRIKKNPNKQTYKNLTYEYMEEFISKHPFAEERAKEYNEMRLRAKCHMCSYALIKSWFLATYPEVDDFSTQEISTSREIIKTSNGVSTNVELPLVA